MQIYPVRGVFFRENQKKCNFFRKIKEKLLEIRKIVVPLYWVKELTRPTERVFGTKKQTVMKSVKEIASGIVNAYMEKEGDFIRKHFEGLNDDQAKVMAMAMAALMLKNEISRI